MPPLDRYYPFLLGMGLILSPLNFAALGNTAGLTGSYFPIVLLSVLAVHLLTAHSYQALFSDGPGEEREASQDTPKTDPFLILLLGSRLSLAISAVPLILVSAGFIFNELFLYWFPNFGFAYGMLIILLLLNLLGEKTVLRTQIIFVGIALVGIWLISTIGLWSAIFSPEAVKHASPGSGPAFPGIAAALLLFVGFDLAELDRYRREQDLFGAPLRGWRPSWCYPGCLFCSGESYRCFTSRQPAWSKPPWPISWPPGTFSENPAPESWGLPFWPAPERR